MTDSPNCTHRQFTESQSYCPDCGLSRSEVLVATCEPFLKDDETPAECIARNRRDADGCLTMLIAERRKVEALRSLLADAQVAYVARGMELRDAEARLAEEVKNKKEFERDWLAACDELCNTRSRLADIESQNRVMWDVANDREARLAEAEAENARLVAANKARDEFLRGHRYKHSEVDGYIDLCESQMATLKARLAEAQDKALRFDLDQTGIEARERDAVELVELRSRLADWHRMADERSAEIVRLSTRLAEADALLRDISVHADAVTRHAIAAFLTPDSAPAVTPFCGPFPEQSEDERTLRYMLAIRCGEPGELYGDDGELQLGGFPYPIDFRRDSVAEIRRKLDARGMAKLAAQLQAADSASACTCDGEYKYDGDCPVHGDPSFASDQPNAARKTVWKPYDVFGVTGRLVYEDTGEDAPDQPGEAAK